MKQQELSVLTNVIAVARRELADRDDDEIPARMRPVAKRSGGRLVLPLQKSLIKYIRTSETFRESVLERWETEGIDDAVGLEFLKDPDSGINEVDGIAFVAHMRRKVQQSQRRRNVCIDLGFRKNLWWVDK